MALFCLEVKERCAALVQITILLIGSVSAIAKFVTQQLAGYTYMFLVPPNVRTSFFL